MQCYSKTTRWCQSATTCLLFVFRFYRITVYQGKIIKVCKAIFINIIQNIILCSLSTNLYRDRKTKVNKRLISMDTIKINQMTNCRFLTKSFYISLKITLETVVSLVPLYLVFPSSLTNANQLILRLWRNVEFHDALGSEFLLFLKQKQLEFLLLKRLM